MRCFSLAVLGGFICQSIAVPAPLPSAPPIVGNYVLLGRSGGHNPAIPPQARIPFGQTPNRTKTSITRDQITFENSGNVWAYQMGTGTPQTLELSITPLRGKPTIHKGIIETNGNRLMIAYAAEGEDRPKDFDDAPGVMVYVLQKEPPPPKWEYRIVTLAPDKAAEVEKQLNALAQEGFEVAFATNGSAAQPTAHYLLKRLKP